MVEATATALRASTEETAIKMARESGRIPRKEEAAATATCPAGRISPAAGWHLAPQGADHHPQVVARGRADAELGLVAGGILVRRPYCVCGYPHSWDRPVACGVVALLPPTLRLADARFTTNFVRGT